VLLCFAIEECRYNGRLFGMADSTQRSLWGRQGRGRVRDSSVAEGSACSSDRAAAGGHHRLARDPVKNRGKTCHGRRRRLGCT
jgi:hypothetical protein